MSYKRRHSYYDPSYPSTTKVSIHWSNKSASYAIKFADTKNWNQMQICIGYLKNITYGERDYDSENKVWFLIEKHIGAFKEIITSLNQYFELDFIPKPENQVNIHQFIPIDVYFDRFKNLTGQDIRNLDSGKAKKIYLKWLMINHPDKGGDHIIARDVNEAWTELEKNFFKSKKEPEYVS
jgi:hypothetical protein